MSQRNFISFDGPRFFTGMGPWGAACPCPFSLALAALLAASSLAAYSPSHALARGCFLLSFYPPPPLSPPGLPCGLLLLIRLLVSIPSSSGLKALLFLGLFWSQLMREVAYFLSGRLRREPLSRMGVVAQLFFNVRWSSGRIPMPTHAPQMLMPQRQGRQFRAG